MRQRAWSALVHVMACRLFGAKPLPEPMLVYCQIGGHFVQEEMSQRRKHCHVTTLSWAAELVVSRQIMMQRGHFIHVTPPINPKYAIFPIARLQWGGMGSLS